MYQTIPYGREDSMKNEVVSSKELKQVTTGYSKIKHVMWSFVGSNTALAIC